jgi:hypothetical protein
MTWGLAMGLRADWILRENVYEGCGTVLMAQLTQSISQLSLKPGEEEIKKKGWWQFWK